MLLCQQVPLLTAPCSGVGEKTLQETVQLGTMTIWQTDSNAAGIVGYNKYPDI